MYILSIENLTYQTGIEMNLSLLYPSYPTSVHRTSRDNRFRKLEYFPFEITTSLCIICLENNVQRNSWHSDLIAADDTATFDAIAIYNVLSI